MDQLARLAPDRLHRRTRRQGLAIAVRDHAPTSCDLADAQVATLAFIAQIVGLDHLAIENRHREHHEGSRKNADQQTPAQKEIGLRSTRLGHV
jgi:hypothetical protein